LKYSRRRYVKSRGQCQHRTETLDQDQPTGVYRLRRTVCALRRLCGDLAGAGQHAVQCDAELGDPYGWLVLYPRGCAVRSEEHTSELQSRENLVCRLLLE